MKNWRTTLASVGVAVLNLLANGATVKQIALSAAALALGAFASDGKTVQALQQ